MRPSQQGGFNFHPPGPGTPATEPSSPAGKQVGWISFCLPEDGGGVTRRPVSLSLPTQADVMRNIVKAITK